MNEKTTQSTVSLCVLLTIVFAVLKLTGCIDWPWLYVFIPVFIELSVTLILLLVLAGMLLFSRRGRNG